MIKLLVYSSDHSLRQSLAVSLPNKKYNLAVCASKTSFLYRCFSVEIDLLLIDLDDEASKLLELCAKLREKNVNTPLLTLHQQHDQRFIIDALRAGADGYLHKPLNYRLLLAKIDNMLNRRGLDGSKLKLGEMVIDKARRSLQAGKNSLDLQRREFNILFLLAASQGRVLTREQINSRTTNISQQGSEDSTIDVHISNLRRKLKKLGDGSPIIETVHGIGYRLTTPSWS